MTLAEVIAAVDELRPNHYDKDQMTAWINEVEKRVVRDIINRAEGNDDVFVPYVYDVNAETDLRIQDAHQQIYIFYILSRMDFFNAEYDRYNADAMMFEEEWNDYAAEYRREHMPKSYETSIYSCEHT